MKKLVLMVAALGLTVAFAAPSRRTLRVFHDQAMLTWRHATVAA
jgi:hypothetical protein